MNEGQERAYRKLEENFNILKGKCKAQEEQIQKMQLLIDRANSKLKVNFSDVVSSGKIGQTQRQFKVTLGYPYKDDVQINHDGIFYACDDRGWGLQLNFTEDKHPTRYAYIKTMLDSIISNIREIEKFNCDKEDYEILQGK